MAVAMLPAAEFSGPHPSAEVLLTLLVILCASLWVFATLVRRETRHRRLVALTQWARSHRMQHLSADSQSQAPELASLKQFNPRIVRAISGKRTTLAQIETADIGVTAAAASRRQWNVAMRELTGKWTTTALRPTAQTVTLVDLFSLSSYPSLMSTERFVIFGAEARAAKALAESTAPALLPADLALVIVGNCLILDFSSRHFDEIEFDRLIDLLDQLAPRLSSAE
jgi:hypothetical protein